MVDQLSIITNLTYGNYLGFYFFIIIKFFSAMLLLRARTSESNKSYSFPFFFCICFTNH
ncbi:hypothetical protein BGAPBR_E0049 (plasmid) [Borreliella garinii PBr]|uniref:Uncharacterized protein n=1 Tax=Borreliella garinii PBr TaxID=498743 RepID=B8F0M9_BORGR|nr:hypothetical protein BGAPBR_E0049 [Borreliella garinii PBr]